ncbi:hypothetical protein [Flavobacterium tibetense]|uniref:Uncharacterized protein n=1 Tax=Flavobacterium tibetense TaxID=2233533 RepID=A0A365P2S4_9FLAO|nr:hypothetical protein [Flavobacterium tibetense]RBA28797.1 hypothetical protein DPN68_05255 [Flavobacterium tibetense]
MDTDKEKNEIFAHIKYEGELVKDGFLDARKAGEALIGIDESLRYFLYQEDKKFRKVEFEIPVRIRKGSWETIFLENFDAILIKTALAWGASKYFGSALSEMAKNDFKDIGFKDVFKKSFVAMTWVLKISKHLGTLTKKKFENLKFTKNNTEVLITNYKGEILTVPYQYLEIFSNCPDKLFSNLAKVIDEERELVIGYNDTVSNKFEFVRINNIEKQIFIPTEESDETLFPELIHNSYIELEGHITRGNEKSNTIGFLYEGHILTSYPTTGNVKEFKNVLFTNCIIKGYIDRLDKKTGEFIEKRPRIKFIEILSNEPENRQTKLF